MIMKNKLDNIQTTFTIKDLENLSGIKAHTIRIWEKRYHVLEPSRTSTNIRYYDISNLQKLLNVTLLYNQGYKISKIAALSNPELQQLVRDHLAENSSGNLYTNSFKLAMLNFDQHLFEDTFRQLKSEYDFSEIFMKIFLPLLEEIGTLWQSDTISPAHEHFISNLIKQKLLTSTEQLRQVEKKLGKVFVLYLPLNEIHELGLMFIHYELMKKGYHSIYLGPSVPIDNLKSLQRIHNNICYVSYFVVQPATGSVGSYLQQFSETLLNDGEGQLWVLGQKVRDLSPDDLPKGVSVFKRIETVLAEV